MAAACILGLAAGPVFPALIASTPHRLGPDHAANAVGVQVAASAIGQSLVPTAVGLAAAGFGLEAVPRLLALGAAVLFATYAALDRIAPALGSVRARRVGSSVPS